MAAKLDLSVDRHAGTTLGAQLAARIRSALDDGTLAAGDRLPSVRDLAKSAAVNVNTVRSVYARLESEGIVRSEQGRGTFVTGPPHTDAAERRELRKQIAELEAALARLPPPPTLATEPSRAARRTAAALLSTEDLQAVRDQLLMRLDDLDAQRAELLQKLEQLGVDEGADARTRRATPSLAGARIRWVGA
jgi:DNA-binding transcriptional regulator YhcF (GntR family)